AGLAGTQRRLRLAGEMLDVDYRPPGLAPRRLEPRDVPLEIGVVAVVLGGVDVHAVLNVYHEEDSVLGKRGHGGHDGASSVSGGRMSGRAVMSDDASACGSTA